MDSLVRPGYNLGVDEVKISDTFQAAAPTDNQLESAQTLLAQGVFRKVVMAQMGFGFKTYLELESAKRETLDASMTGTLSSYYALVSSCAEKVFAARSTIPLEVRTIAHVVTTSNPEIMTELTAGLVGVSASSAAALLQVKDALDAL